MPQPFRTRVLEISAEFAAGEKASAGRILSEADRLECLFFGGFDPHFVGDEHPGL
jgi:hypothetical protein